MKLNTFEKRNVTTTQAVKLLEKNGVTVTEEEAKKILDFLYFLSKLTVHQYFNEKKD